MPEEAAKKAAKEKELLTLVETEKDETVLEKELKEKMEGEIPDSSNRTRKSNRSLRPWFRYFLTYDPAVALRKVKCPVLAINGSLDKQVLPDQNLPAIRKALEEAGNKHFEIDELPGLNHLFQTAKTGSPAEYAEIEETISPVALEKIVELDLEAVKQHAGRHHECCPLAIRNTEPAHAAVTSLLLRRLNHHRHLVARTLLRDEFFFAIGLWQRVAVGCRKNNAAQERIAAVTCEDEIRIAVVAVRLASGRGHCKLPREAIEIRKRYDSRRQLSTLY